LRTIDKIEYTHAIGLSVKIDGVEKFQDTFPSRPAFVMNALSQFPEMLEKFNEPEMTSAELAQLEAWVAEVDATLLDHVDLRPKLD